MYITLRYGHDIFSAECLTISSDEEEEGKIRKIRGL